MDHAHVELLAFEPTNSSIPSTFAGGGLVIDSDDKPEKCCQVDENQSLKGQQHCPLLRAKLAPLGDSGGVVELEIGA
ncbi:hypothetical protein A9Q94_15600 [Rhodobacterales bacterium 56_14_T64]|nr:hypothetical protein A9Q94_15600 [Rhodobacterales bacterium 56_14_T64]